ncbi:MAG: HK97 gp10 family phage protein [Candidatus Bathyarchaeota archaeon]|nr:HK97 gp10 family phage protein [Candidatus Bathyarchaeota archaeon]
MSIEMSCYVEGVEEFKQAMQTFDSSMQKHVRRQLESWAEDVKALAKKLVPVRTGHLRNTIYAKIREWVAEIGAEAAYALFVEFGTRYMQARPYLFPAVRENLPRLERIICDALEQAKAEAGL